LRPPASSGLFPVRTATLVKESRQRPEGFLAAAAGSRARLLDAFRQKSNAKSRIRFLLQETVELAPAQSAVQCAHSAHAFPLGREADAVPSLAAPA
jgi:hypothetical protein